MPLSVHVHVYPPSVVTSCFFVDKQLVETRSSFVRSWFERWYHVVIGSLLGTLLLNALLTSTHLQFYEVLVAGFF